MVDHDYIFIELVYYGLIFNHDCRRLPSEPWLTMNRGRAMVESKLSAEAPRGGATQQVASSCGVVVNHGSTWLVQLYTFEHVCIHICFLNMQ